MVENNINHFISLRVFEKFSPSFKNCMEKIPHGKTERTVVVRKLTSVGKRNSNVVIPKIVLAAVNVVNILYPEVFETSLNNKTKTIKTTFITDPIIYIIIVGTM